MTKKKINIPGNWWVGAGVVALVVSVAMNILLLLRGGTGMEGVKVRRVIDGDTLEIEDGERIRLKYVDAPELTYCGGQEATEYLEKLTKDGNIRIEDPTPDQYGRTVAMVYRGRDSVNKEMLSSGWARFFYLKEDYDKNLRETVEKAKEEGKGIYGLCQSKDVPDKAGCLIKGNIDNSGKNRIYYLPGCAQYNFTVIEKDMGEGWFCTEEEAQKAGFVKAKTC